MPILWILLISIYSITNVVPAEAKALANYTRGTKLMAETTENSNELASDRLVTYNIVRQHIRRNHKRNQQSNANV